MRKKPLSYPAAQLFGTHWAILYDSLNYLSSVKVVDLSADENPTLISGYTRCRCVIINPKSELVLFIIFVVCGSTIRNAATILQIFRTIVLRNFNRRRALS